MLPTPSSTLSCFLQLSQTGSTLQKKDLLPLVSLLHMQLHNHLGCVCVWMCRYVHVCLCVYTLFCVFVDMFICVCVYACAHNIITHPSRPDAVPLVDAFDIPDERRWSEEWWKWSDRGGVRSGGSDLQGHRIPGLCTCNGLFQVVLQSMLLT